jgi:hypothetical protein
MTPEEFVEDLEAGGLLPVRLAHRGDLWYAWDGFDQFGLHELLHVDGDALSLEDVREILHRLDAGEDAVCVVGEAPGQVKCRLHDTRLEELVEAPGVIGLTQVVDQVGQILGQGLEQGSVWDFKEEMVKDDVCQLRLLEHLITDKVRGLVISKEV